MKNSRDQKGDINGQPVEKTHIPTEEFRTVISLNDDEINIVT